MHVYPFFVTIAPDEPYLLIMYPMVEESDFAQQTVSVNAIDDFLITEERRIICYSQPIYEDIRLEPDEYVGLPLRVAENEQTTVFTTVKSMYDQASILIVDNDSEYFGGIYSSIVFFNNYNSLKIILV